MRDGKPSSTAVWVSFLRALGRFESPPLVDDAAAAALLPPAMRFLLAAADRMPRSSRLLLAAAHAATAEGTRHLTLRTRAIDDVVIDAVRDRAAQVVLLGAGLDLRATRLPLRQGVPVFEIDHPATQRYKKRRLARASEAVRYVACDFESDRLATTLLAAGFQPSHRTVVVWEGVTMYLADAAIDGTLTALASLLSPGSILATTYLARRPPAPLRLFVDAVGEPFRSHSSEAAWATRLRGHGFAPIRDESPRTWCERYLGRTTRLPIFERLSIATRT